MEIRQIAILLAVTVILVVGLIGYGYSKRQDTKDESSVVVRIADLPVIQALPLYVALEQGYFAEAGVHVERVRMDSPNLIIDALLSGKVDMASPSGALGIAGVAEFKNPGVLKIYSAVGGDFEIPNDSFLVAADSSIESIGDFRGKRIGILPGIQWRTIAKHILAQHDINADEEVQIVDLAPALQAPALASGQIDALLAIEPMVTIVKERGIGKEVLRAPTSHHVANPFFGGAGVVRSAFADEHPELVSEVLEILQHALRDVRENPDVHKLHAKGYTPLDDDLVAKAPVMKFRFYNELSETDVDALQDFYDIFTTYSVVEGRIDARSLIYESQ